MRHRILLAAAFAYLAAANFIWVAKDSRPPFWDMAFHADAALQIRQAISQSGFHALRIIPALTGYYPPLYHTAIALVWSLFGTSVAAARLANLIPLAVLMIATYRIGKTVLTDRGAAVAAMLVGFYPFLLWLSRETIIDFWLTAIVALAVWTLLETNEFSNRYRSIFFGAVCGLGLLTKWYFPFFLALPVIWLARRNLKNAVIAAFAAALVAAYWYVPSWTALSALLKINNAGAAAEGDPARWTWQALLFYIRILAGYQIFFPLFCVFVAGCLIVWKRYNPAWLPILLWIAGGWLGMMLFQNKDPRYTAPMLPAIALVSATVFDRRAVLSVVLVPFLLFQHYLVSFGIKKLPESVVLMQGISGPMSWDWNLYTQNYFKLWGRPAREDWNIQHVLNVVTDNGTHPARLGIIPDIPRFDSMAFGFYADLLRLPATIQRVGIYDESAIRNNDYLVVSESPSPFAGSAEPDRDRIDSYVFAHPEQFKPVEWFSLPDGQVIRLYIVGRS